MENDNYADAHKDIETSLKYKLHFYYIVMFILIFNFAFSITDNSKGELSRKIVAKSFWEQELHEELADLGLAETWVFCEEKGKMQGTQVDAMEHVENVRCEMLYSHECSDRCKEKGN